jgi:hypothetical protein
MFADRYAAEQSLASCYWALPRTGWDWNKNPGIFGSMEAIINRERIDDAGMRIALGYNSATSPVMNYWNSSGDDTRSVYAGMRDCNVFLDNIESCAFGRYILEQLRRFADCSGKSFRRLGQYGGIYSFERRTLLRYLCPHYRYFRQPFA